MSLIRSGNRTEPANVIPSQYYRCWYPCQQPSGTTCTDSAGQNRTDHTNLDGSNGANAAGFSGGRAVTSAAATANGYVGDVGAGGLGFDTANGDTLVRMGRVLLPNSLTAQYTEGCLSVLGSDNGWRVSVDTGNAVTIAIGTDQAENYASYALGSNADGVLFDYVMVIDGTLKQLYGYLDGVLGDSAYSFSTWTGSVRDGVNPSGTNRFVRYGDNGWNQNRCDSGQFFDLHTLVFPSMAAPGNMAEIARKFHKRPLRPFTDAEFDL